MDGSQDVIYHLETYDVTTIRAGTPLFLLARKIKVRALSRSPALSLARSLSLLRASIRSLSLYLII